MTEHIDRQDAANTDRPFERKIVRTLDQCRRFTEIAALLGRGEQQQPVGLLTHRLQSDDIPLKIRERIMVILAVSADDTAREVLDDYDPGDGPEEHRLFHQVARIECEERRRRRLRCAA